MRNIYKNKFIFWNLIALVFIKAVFSYSGFQLADLISGAVAFPKEDVIAQTNALRESLGLNDLKENNVLDTAAAQKLQDMIQNSYFAHTSPAGISPWHWIDINQYKYSYAGENLAIGFLTAKDTVDAWANSPSHRANLLNSNYKEIGIAVAPAKIQDSQGFLVVQLFGTPVPITVSQVSSAPKKVVKPKPPTISTPIVTPAIPKTTVFASPEVKSATEKIEQPVAIITNNTSQRLNNVSHIFNTAFILYALVAFLTSVVLLAFYGLRKGLVARIGFSFAILVLAIVVPVLQIAHTALII